MLKNKKGFTLIELIIVVAIMAVLIALLAPNVLKYLDKSRVSKDMSSLDTVKTALNAELMDEKFADYATDADLADGKLSGIALKNFNDGDSVGLYEALFDGGIIDKKFETNEIFASKAAKDGWVVVFVDGNGGLAVAAVDESGNLVYSDKDDEETAMMVTFNLRLEEYELVFPAELN